MRNKSGRKKREDSNVSVCRKWIKDENKSKNNVTGNMNENR